MMRILAVALVLISSPALAQGKGKAAKVHPGAEVYQNVCQACHMANGMGGEGAGRITALAKNPNLEYPEYPISVVTGGRGAMPWFRGTLSDQEIADVISYVRKNFGNRYKGDVTVAMVEEIGAPAPKGGRGGR
jgi:mono/diheme cytochrome c family protein